MKRITNLIIIIVSLALAGALTFSIFTVAKNIEKANSDNSGGEIDENDDDQRIDYVGSVDSDAGTKHWTLENGDLKLSTVIGNNSFKTYYVISLDGLEAGEYSIFWNIKGSFLDESKAHFLLLSDTSNNISGYGYGFNYHYGLNADGKLLDDNTKYFFTENCKDILSRSAVFSLTESGGFTLVLFEYDAESRDDAITYSTFISENFLDMVVLTKVG